MIRKDRRDHKATVTVADSGYKVVIATGDYSHTDVETHYASNSCDVGTVIANYFNEPDEKVEGETTS